MSSKALSQRLRNQQGFTLVEAVVTITVFAVGLLGLVQLSLVAKSSTEASRDTVQVSNYIQEGLEAVRTVRDSNWTNVDTDGSYRLNPLPTSNPPWQLIADGTEPLGKYNRSVTIASVRRVDVDGSGTLTAGDRIDSAGTLNDPNTKKITVLITWQNGTKTYTRSLFLYLTNWR